MRVTSNMYYKNIFNDSSKANEKLFDVNKQISSGLKIQYAGDDVSTFADTMRLDNELTTLGQIKGSAGSASKMSTQADTVLNEFQTTMDRTRTLLLQASNSSQSEASMDAIAAELRGLESHLKNLSNTSINGQYLFSGSAVDVKPIAADGSYMGNDVSMNAFLGSRVEQQYNLTGADLFLGEEVLVKRQVTTNVPQYNLSAKYPDFSDPASSLGGIDKTITVSDTIRDLMGDLDANGTAATNHFYLSGAKSDGTSFTKQISMSGSSTVDELLTQIGNAYGNTADLKVVNVSLNAYGEIVIEDKMKGSSKLDFHMVGAVDYDVTGGDAADVNNAIYGTAVGSIDNLDDGETNFDKIINGTSTAANTNLYIKSFVQSPFSTVAAPASELVSAEFAMSRAVAAVDTLSITVDNGDATTTAYTQLFNADPATTYDDLKNQIEADGDFTVTVNGDTITLNATAQGVAKGVSINTDLANDNGSLTGAVTVVPTIINSIIATDIDALVYDKTQFTKDGSKLSSNISQIVRGTNAFASPSTKISEVADLSQGIAGTLDGTQFTISGTDTSGNAYTAQIDFATAGSTFSLDGGVTNYSIFNMATPRTAVDADKMTYQQLMDVTNMIVTGSLPAVNTEAGYDTAISSAESSGSTFLSYDGKIQFKDATSSNTKASLAMYDSNSGDFSIGADASVMTFNSNNALTVRDPKTDFFKNLREAITAVENYKLYPDSKSGDMRSVGIENAISIMDDLMEHVGGAHAVVGAQSNALTNALERTQLLETSTMTLRSSVIDTDIAEASLMLTQLSLNLQAMLSTVAKVSKLSLVNYL